MFCGDGGEKIAASSLPTFQSSTYFTEWIGGPLFLITLNTVNKVGHHWPTSKMPF